MRRPLENPAIEERNPSIQSEKLSIEKLKNGFLNKNYRENTKDNILAVYNDIDINQIFGAPEIERILDCSPTTAKEIMRKIRDMEVVVEVKGSGKGKYRFIFYNKSKIRRFVFGAFYICYRLDAEMKWKQRRGIYRMKEMEV